MSSLYSETRTFRGDTLEDALRKVREELGPEALVVRQREGVIGGIGGFFGRHCVEIDVQAPTTPEKLVRVLPGRSVIDLYDSGEHVDPAAQAQDDFLPEDTFHDDDAESPLVRTLLDQASPFAAQLAEAIETAQFEPAQFESAQFKTESLPDAVEAMPAVEKPAETGASTEDQDEPVAALVADTEPEVVEPVSMSVAPAFDPVTMRHHLATSGLDEALAAAVVTEAETELRLFDPVTPFAHQVQVALARRITVRRSAKKRRRVIALIGPAGSGKTLAASRLCHAYRYGAGRTVAALSLEPLRKALELSRRLEQLDVELAVANDRTALEVTLGKLAHVDVIILDTPAVDPRDTAGMQALRDLLELIGPDETHLLVPQQLDVAAVTTLVDTAPALGADRLLLTRLDGAGSIGAAVSASIRTRIPISFTSTGTPWGLRPADPNELAGRIVS